MFNEAALAEQMYGQLEPPRFQLGRLALKSYTDYFNSTGNLDVDGLLYSDLAGDFSAVNSYLGVENDFSQLWSGSVGLLFGYSQSKNSRDERTNLNIKGVQFGLSRKLLNPYDINLIIDAKAFFKAYSVSADVDEVSLGDGVSWVQAGAWLGSDRFKYLRLWGYGGFNYNFGSLSQNLVYAIKPEIKAVGIRLGAAFEGQIPIIDDTAANNPTSRLRIINEYNGGSFYYHPINARFLSGQLWVGFSPAKFTEMKVGLVDYIGGTNAADGTKFFVNLEVSFTNSRVGLKYPFIKRNKTKKDPRTAKRRLKNYSKPKKEPDPQAFKIALIAYENLVW